jgi:serine/threonine-protein kinase
VNELRAGTEITKNVKLLYVLSRGGAGTVWLGKHSMLNMPVAVKLISKEIMSPEARARFTREALVAARLKSAHVVRMFDHGATSDGVPFIVMELCQGEDLGCRLKRTGTLTLAETRTVAKQLTSALMEAHGQGLVHRDIKPGNVFLEYGDDGQPFVRLLDFGLCKEQRPDPMLRTATGMVMGTPNYMSPEQAFDSSRADHRADLWAVAAVLYHCLTGVRPFRAESYGGLFVALARGRFDPPSVVRPELGTEHDAFFERAFHPNRELRHQSARELRDAFLNGEKPVEVERLPASAPSARSHAPFAVAAALALVALFSVTLVVLVGVRAGWHVVIAEKTQSLLR